MLSPEHGLKLRRATATDCRLLWEWANDPIVRAAAFQTSPIAWHEHQSWFEQKLSASNCVILIAEGSQGEPVGQIRFDWSASASEVDVSVAKESRGRGHGALLIRDGTVWFFREVRVSLVSAFVKSGNLTSARAFERARYVCRERLPLHGVEVLRYVADKDSYAPSGTSQDHAPANTRPQDKNTSALLCL